jgi:hypothetical protein
VSAILVALYASTGAAGRVAVIWAFSPAKGVYVVLGIGLIVTAILAISVRLGSIDYVDQPLNDFF